MAITSSNGPFLQQGPAFLLANCTIASPITSLSFTDAACKVPFAGTPIPYTLAANSIKFQAMRTVVIGLLGATALLTLPSFV